MNGIISKNFGFENIFRYNSTLTCLILRNLHGFDVLQFSESVFTNPDHAIQVLDLSYTEISSKANISLAKAIKYFPHALLVLRLRGCHLSAKSFEVLFEAFQDNYGVSLSIEELDLSDNKIEEEGSVVFKNWLGNARKFSHLRELHLSHTAINYHLIGPWIAELPCLDVLDVSNNKLDEESFRLIRLFIDAHRVKILRTNGTGMSPSDMQLIVSGINGITTPKKIELNVSSNDVSRNSSGDIIYKSLTANLSLSILYLDDLNLSITAVTNVLKTLSACQSLTKLSFGRNVHGSKEGHKVATILGEFINNAPQVISLSLVGDSRKRFKDSLSAFFIALINNTTLKELDIQDNKMGDVGMFTLAKALQINKSLISLHIDKNEIGLNGFLVLQDVLTKYNQTLQYMPFPHFDVEKAKINLENPYKKQQLTEIMLFIQTLLNSRLNFSSFQNFPLSSPDYSSLSLSYPISLPCHNPPLYFVPTNVQPLTLLPEPIKHLTKERASLRTIPPHVLNSSHYEPQSRSTIRANQVNELVEQQTMKPTPTTSPKPTPEMILPKVVTALYPFESKDEGVINFKPGQLITVYESPPGQECKPSKYFFFYKIF